MMPELCKSTAIALIALGLSFTVSAQSQVPKWVTGYYPFWWYAELPPELLDMNSLTHIVIFSANPDTSRPPFLDVVNNAEDSANVEAGQETGQASNYLERTISLAHAKGVRILLSVGGAYGPSADMMNIIANDSTDSELFVSAACAYAKRKGLDGIEIDWEFPRLADRTAWNRLIRLFRNELDGWDPAGLFFAAVSYAIDPVPNDSYFAYQRDSMMVFDQINPMTYTMWVGTGTSGFDTPVNLPTQFSEYAGSALGGPIGPLTYLQAGYPPSKLGISISFEGTEFDSVTTMGQPYAGWKFVYETDIPDSGRRWDTTAQAAWCVKGDTVYSYQDTNSVRAICSWATKNGYNGIMLYDLGAGYIPTNPVPDLLLKTAYREFIGEIASTDRERLRSQSLPRSTTLWQNYPNPFNPKTVISYQLSAVSKVRLVVHDLLGREVAILVDAEVGVGSHEVEFNATGLASGVYFVQFSAGSYSQAQRMILVK